QDRIVVHRLMKIIEKRRLDVQRMMEVNSFIVKRSMFFTSFLLILTQEIEIIPITYLLIPANEDSLEMIITNLISYFLRIANDILVSQFDTINENLAISFFIEK